MKKVVVIGAGASGLMAAYAAAKNGHDVTVIEKNEKAGKKIYITGKGRCNITNDILPDEFFANVVNNAKFLYGCIHTFSPQKLMEFLEKGGLSLKTERGGRVFPLSDKASDVTACLMDYCKNAGVKFCFNENVEKIEVNQGTLSGIITQNRKILTDCVVVATGGKSYPGTGSTGDGYRFAELLGLKVIPPRPALCGINCDMSHISSLQGLALKNVRISAVKDNKEIASFFGEMLFTHFGISGPTVLSLSSILNKFDLRQIRLYIDLKPALDKETLDKRILRDFQKFHEKEIQNALVELLPKSLILPVLNSVEIPANIRVSSFSRANREKLVNVLKAFKIIPVSLRDFSECIVTAGGVDVKEINPKTMECKKISGLYFTGEVLDVDAFTGGYNLQIAFSTGYVAGSSI